MNEPLASWNEYLKSTYSYYNSLILSHNEPNTCFKGFKVWYSPYKVQPKLLIIGINPGQNEGSCELPISLTESDVFEYLADKKDYRLANQIKRVFSEAGLLKLLQTDTIKTNYYHIITSNQSQIKSGLNRVQRGLFIEYDNHSQEINRRLIDICKPEYIFCEGKYVYDKIINLYADATYSQWEGDCGYTQFEDRGLTIIGCSRRMSNIKNKAALSELLKRVVKFG